MFNKKINLIFIACLIFISIDCLFAQENNVTKKLPSVNVKTLEGTEIDIATLDNKGAPIVFVCWATWCGPCIKELNNIADLYEEWQEETGVKIYAVSIDDSRTTSKIGPFVEGKRWTYEVLLDPNQDFMRALGFSNPPFSAVVNKDKEIVWTHNSYIQGDEYELEAKIKEIAQKQ